MSRSTTGKTEQVPVRLPQAEATGMKALARKRSESNNDVVRRALRLLSAVEREIRAGARLVVRRPGRKPEEIEVWLL